MSLEDSIERVKISDVILLQMIKSSSQNDFGLFLSMSDGWKPSQGSQVSLRNKPVIVQMDFLFSGKTKQNKKKILKQNFYKALSSGPVIGETEVLRDRRTSISTVPQRETCWSSGCSFYLLAHTGKQSPREK